MTFRPPKAPRRNEYLKNGNFCRSVLLRLIAPKPDLQMQTSPLDRPFLSCSDPWSRSREVGPPELASDLMMRVLGWQWYRRHGTRALVVGALISGEWKVLKVCWDTFDHRVNCFEVHAITQFVESSPVQTQPFADHRR